MLLGNVMRVVDGIVFPTRFSLAEILVLTGTTVVDALLCIGRPMSCMRRLDEVIQNIVGFQTIPRAGIEWV